MVNTAIKRASLDDAYDASLVAPATTLRAKLRAYETAARARVSAGQLLASTAANGHSVSYFPLDTGDLTPSDIIEMWRELIDLHDLIKTQLGGSPTDAQIKEEMMGRLVPAYESSLEMAGLRFCAA